MTYAVVLPWCVAPIYEKCARSLKLDNVLTVDNSGKAGRNLGIMRSHNLGIDYMRELDADWLVVMSAACRFGREGGRDFTGQLDEHTDAVVVYAEGVYGWHLIAFHRDTFEAIGRFDENFHPYGYDDCDLAIRVHKAFPSGRWAGVQCSVSDRAAGMAHSLKVGGVHVEAPPQLLYWEQKWGAPPGQDFPAYHDSPFGDPALPLGWWPSSPLTWGAAWDQPAPAERYG